jgi:hypothetical protein
VVQKKKNDYTNDYVLVENKNRMLTMDSRSFFSWKKFFLIALISSCSLFIQNVLAEKSVTAPTMVKTKTYLSHITLGGYYFDHQPRSAGLGELFYPLVQSPNQLFFGDLRAYDKSGSAFEGNVALGYRWIRPQSQHLYGLYASFDRLRSDNRNYFNQLTFGGETWWSKLFLGGNVYLPVGSKRVMDSSFNTTESRDNGAYKNIYYGPGFEQALTGVDAEVGLNFWKGFILYLGGYYYGGSDVPDVTGPRGRLTYTWFSTPGHRLLKLFDRISIQTQLQHDSPRGTNFYAGLRLSVNLGKNTVHLTPVQQHMLDRLRRDLDVVTEPNHESFNRLNNDDGSPVRVLNVSTQSGFENALTDTNADIVAVQNTISGLSDEVIGEGQTITGGAHSFIVNGQPYVAYLSPGGRLEAAADSDLLQLSANNTVENIVLRINATQDTSAIYNDNTVDDMGDMLVRGVNSNGPIVFTRNGSGKTGSVVVTLSIINTGTLSASSFRTFGGIGFIATNDGVLSMNANNNLVTTNGERMAGIFARTQYGNSSITGPGIRNNTISTGEDSTFSIQLSTLGSSQNVTLNRISNNRITHNGMVDPICLINYAGADTSSINITEGIFNNKIVSTATITSLTRGNIILELRDADSSMTIGGIYNNTIVDLGDFHAIQIDSTGTVLINNGGIYNNDMNSTAEAISIEGSQTQGTYGTTTINGFHDNSFTGGNKTIALETGVGEGTINIDVDSGNKCLSGANNNATVSTSGTGTININPCS